MEAEAKGAAAMGADAAGMHLFNTLSFLVAHMHIEISINRLSKKNNCFFTHQTYISIIELGNLKSIDLSISNPGEKLSNYRYRSIGKRKECPPLVTSAARLYWSAEQSLWG